mgnify:FL=1
MKKIFKHRFTKLLLILTLGIILMWQVVIPLLESSKTIFNILGIIVGGFSIVEIILH